MKINNNVILITGGATGIGFALARAMCENNRVIICGRRENKLIEAKKSLPKINIKKCDITSKTERKELLDYILNNFGGLDILINNAGVQKPINFALGNNEFIDNDFEIDINFKAQIYMTSIFMPLLLKSNNPSIINVSSGLAFVPLSNFPIYCATKAALHSFSISLRHQLRNTNIKVFEIMPPYIYDTELKDGKINLEKPPFGMSSEEFAKIVINSLTNDKYEIGPGGTNDLSNVIKEDFYKKFDMMNK
ncbi:MAG: SDR family NAD(P)-dependent oxidoreductase [Candidatus Marsarchaeota archaeon]|nr:SDR family NAD(P)-dependent oxidoreductase [Candidatus Marsarchaeota archaeon]